MQRQHKSEKVDPVGSGVGQDSFESHHEGGKPARVKANSRSRHDSGGVPKSHIVGHINQDGSIRPICNVGEDEQNIQTSPMPVVNADEVIVISQNSSSSIGLANELTIRDEGGTNRADESGSEIAEEG